MALNTIISAAAASAMCDAIVDLVDAGAAGGVVQIYDGTQPAGPGTAITTQNLLAEVTLNDPAFGAAASGVASVDASPALTDTSADASGTASWFRVLDSNGVAIWDGTVGTGTHDMVVDSVDFTAGQSFTITAWDVTMPQS